MSRRVKLEPISINPKCQISVRLPRSLFNELTKYATKNHVTITDITLSALAIYLDFDECDTPDQKLWRIEKRLSALEKLVIFDTSEKIK
jgi:NRPS condensation-like uncharacterized protein